ncbi:SURF1 family protein [Tolypothrix campylonemoides VB511288]|nr:SURF1 family protein [Tolypothrix campylonemoides VB511288]
MSRRRTLLVGWMLAIAAVVLFGNLGLWQLRRGVEKQAMLDASARVLRERAPVPLSAAGDAARARGYDWAEGRARFDAREALLLDNQQRDGRVGVRAYRIVVPEAGAPLLVDLGWRALPADRALPATERPDGPYVLRGLLAPPPSAGLALGAPMAKQGDAWLMTRVDLDAIARATGLSVPLAPRVLRLDPALPLGYERDLALLANTLPPDKHRGYAVQWFALAAAVLAIALLLTFRRPRR